MIAYITKKLAACLPVSSGIVVSIKMRMIGNATNKKVHKYSISPFSFWNFVELSTLEVEKHLKIVLKPNKNDIKKGVHSEIKLCLILIYWQATISMALNEMCSIGF